VEEFIKGQQNRIHFCQDLDKEIEELKKHVPRWENKHCNHIPEVVNCLNNLQVWWEGSVCIIPKPQQPAIDQAEEAWEKNRELHAQMSFDTFKMAYRAASQKGER
jgi:hypothetical protein